MEATRSSRAAGFVTRLVPPLAMALLACVSSSSDSTSSATPPSIASLSFYPGNAAVNDGGGMVSVMYTVRVTDPDADATRVVGTVLDAANTQVSQLSEPISNPDGGVSLMIGGTAFVPTTASGTFAVEVQSFDAGGRASNVLRASFVVVERNPVPVIESLSPPSVRAHSDWFTLTLTGSGFVPTSTALWNGHSSLTTTYVDATTLEAQVGPSEVYYAGTAQITVSNPLPGGGTSAPATFVIDPAPPPVPNPVPVIASVSPASVDAGASSVTLTVTGSAFSRSSYVVFDGSYLTTTFVDSTTLTATVSSYELSSPGTATVRVTTPSPGGGTSSALTFTVTRPEQPGVRLVALAANDVVWDPYQRKIYVSVPSLSPVNPNTVTVLDPFTGELTGSQFVGSEPGRMALSDGGQLLYVALGGASSVERLTVPGLALDLSFGLGSDPSYGPYYARDLQVAPGSPSTIAVSLVTTGSSASGGIAVFDDATRRPTRAASPVSWYAYDSLQWGATASALYATTSGYDYDLYTFGVDASGVVRQDTYALSTYAVGIRFDAGTGLVYLDDGRVADPATGLVTGTYSVANMYQRRVMPDSSLGSAFFVSTGASYYGTDATITAFDIDGYYPARSMTVSYVGGPPRRVIRWGTDGLAFLTPDLVVLVRGAVVLPAATTSNPAPVVTSLSPSSATAGGPNLTVAVTGEGFVPGSTVLWSGSERTTRFVSSTTLVAYVPASDVAGAGSADVTVVTPSPGGGTSGAAAFTVSP